MFYFLKKLLFFLYIFIVSLLGVQEFICNIQHPQNTTVLQLDKTVVALGHLKVDMAIILNTKQINI